jgi:hypothetical protein
MGNKLLACLGINAKPKLKGVRVQGTSANLTYTAAQYPRDHPWTTVEDVIQFNKEADPERSCDKFVEMRLKYFQTPKAKRKKSNSPDTPENIDLGYIARCLFYAPSTQGQSRIDTHFVREDGKDLLPEHMEALLMFIIEKCHLGIDEEMDVEKDSSLLFPPSYGMDNGTFEAAWSKYKEEKGWAVDFPSPYEIPEAIKSDGERNAAWTFELTQNMQNLWR